MSNQLLKMSTEIESNNLRKIALALQRLLVQEMRELPIIGAVFDSESETEWIFSHEKTDLDLWKSIRGISKKSTADLRMLIGCSERFASQISEASDEQLKNLPLKSVSSFRCSLSDADIFEMVDIALSESNIRAEYHRSDETDRFIHSFWRTVFLLISHDILLCKSFFNISDNACRQLLKLINSPGIIHYFIEMKGHKFELSCNEAIFSDKLSDKYFNFKSKSAGKKEKSGMYHKNIYKNLIALQQSGGGVSPEKYAAINNMHHNIAKEDKRNSTSLKESIFNYLVAGYSDSEIAEELNIEIDVVGFYKQKFEKENKFRLQNEFSDEMRPFQLTREMLGIQENAKQNRSVFFRGMNAIFWSFMGLSKIQLKLHFGISDAKSKRYRSIAKEYGFIGKHVEPKTSYIERKIIESIFVAFYARIGEGKVLGLLDPFVAHEAFSALCRGLSFDEKGFFKEHITGFDSFAELAKAYRQGHLSLEFCPICQCNYVKYLNAGTGVCEGDCPLCEYRDVHVSRWLTGGVK